MVDVAGEAFLVLRLGMMEEGEEKTEARTTTLPHPRPRIVGRLGRPLQHSRVKPPRTEIVVGVVCGSIERSFHILCSFRLRSQKAGEAYQYHSRR